MPAEKTFAGAASGSPVAKKMRSTPTTLLNTPSRVLEGVKHVSYVSMIGMIVISFETVFLLSFPVSAHAGAKYAVVEVDCCAWPERTGR